MLLSASPVRSIAVAVTLVLGGGHATANGENGGKVIAFAGVPGACPNHPVRRFGPLPTTRCLKVKRTTALGAREDAPPDFTAVDDGDEGFVKDDFARAAEGSPYVPPDKGRKAGVSGSDARSRRDVGTGNNDDYDGYVESTSSHATPRRRIGNVIRRRPNAIAAGASWMDRNNEFSKQVVDEEKISARSEQGRRGSGDRRGASSFNRRRGGNGEGADGRGGGESVNRTFRQDFRGTRVFVQGLPPEASWQDVKDHFRVAGEVVFASVSVDRATGESKRCGVVQFETTDMARNAVSIMREHPLDGYELYVREDFQEGGKGRELSNKMPRAKGPTPPTKWKCANEENADFLSDDDRRNIRALIKARDQARRRRNYNASDMIREELKREYGVHVDDRLKMWWTSIDGKQVPEPVRDAKGEGRWGGLKPWRQIPTTPEHDACVNPDLVNGLLTQRDVARREKDFSTADALLEEARDAPDGELYLRIHDESRTWRIWTDEPPPTAVRHQKGNGRKTVQEQCLDLIEEYAPEKKGEVKMLLEKFPGREYGILKKIKQKYIQ